MNIIDRYILRSHFGPFLFGVSTIVFILLMQFLMNHLDKLVGKGLSEWIILQLIIYNMSWMVILAVPMGVLFSTLMSFGQLSASHEVTIVKASGGSLFRMMRFVIVAGMFVTLGLFWFNDVVLPETNHKLKIMMSDIKRTKPTFAIESGRFSSELDGFTILARKVDSASGMMYGVTIYDERDARKKNIISSDSGNIGFTEDFGNLLLELYNGEIHQYADNNVNSYRIINFDTYTTKSEADGFSFEQTEKDVVSRGDREMNITEMQAIVNKSDSSIAISEKNVRIELNEHLDYVLNGKLPDVVPKKEEKKVTTNFSRIRELKIKELTEGVSNPQNTIKRVNFLKSSIRSDILKKEDSINRARQYKVEIQKKYAIPFACLLFVFVGCPLGIMTKGGNFGLSAGISLGFYIFYWACLIGGEKLADRGLMAPELSMWLGNIIIAILGVLLTLRVNFESLKFLSISKK